MHTAEVEIGDTTWYVHHDGDWSGNVTIYNSSKVPGDGYVSLPFELFEELVGRKRIDEEIARLEQLSGREFLSG